jgi:hypothetical protein
MAIGLHSEVSPLRVGSQFLVGEPLRSADLVSVGVDPDARRWGLILGPCGILFREREVFSGVGPSLADELCCRFLMSAGEHPCKLGRLP